MPLFSASDFDGHETVQFFHDEETGLTCIIAIHNSNLGPALGGCRMWAYESEQDAIDDVLRLSRGMTYKSALAGLNFGGGKAVIIGDPRSAKSPELFRSFGKAVEQLNGRYITAEDVGTSVQDLEYARLETRHVAGITEGGSGDPSPATAYGVFCGIKAAVQHRLGSSDLNGVTVALQGLGSVGWNLGESLHEAGARLIVADLNETAVKKALDLFSAEVADPNRIHEAKADVYAPCALGATLNERSIPEIKAPVIAGSANNQLATTANDDDLRDRKILYAPDYVINAGGVINISHEGPSYNLQTAFAHVGKIQTTLREIFERADSESIATGKAADKQAEDRFMAAA